jgi:hypothetical protein
MITCQHEWVEQCQLRYRVEPPIGHGFQDAHYPLSEKLGGTETIRLWYPDHIVQGCLQTLEFQYPCIDVRSRKKERDILKREYPEYVGLYDQAYYFIQEFAAKRRGQTAARLKIGVHSEEYKNSEETKKRNKRNGQLKAEQGIGFHSLEFRNSPEEKDRKRKMGEELKKQKKGIHNPDFIGSPENKRRLKEIGLRHKENGTGVFSGTPEQMAETGRQVGLSNSISVRVFDPGGAEFVFSSGRSAERELGIPHSSLRALIKNKTSFKRGPWAGWRAEATMS